jgi:predicted nucleic-acid-binding protein
VTAVDTNVVVRVVTQDDPDQLEAALTVFRRGPLFLSKTVLLETEWVLRYCYKLSREAIRGTFQKLLGYPRLQVEDRDRVLQALDWYVEGLDFADALHLASSRGSARRFATFDRELAGSAAGILAGQEPDVELLR